jgi:hypothetical protein
MQLNAQPIRHVVSTVAGIRLFWRVHRIVVVGSLKQVAEITTVAHAALLTYTVGVNMINGAPAVVMLLKVFPNL